MADEDALRPQFLKNFLAGHAVGGGKQEIGGRVKHGKTALAQAFGGGGAGGQQLGGHLVEVGLVPDGGRTRGLGHRVDVVGTVAELDAVHVGDQPRPGDAVAQPRARQVVGLGESVRDNEVLVLFQQRQAAEPGRGKLYIGLVHHHNVVGVGTQHFLNGGHRGQQAGGGVGVGNHDRLVQAAVLFQVDGQVVLQRDDMLRNMQQIAQNRVKTVGYIGKGQRRVFIAERPQGQQQVLVAAVAAQNILRLHAPVGSDGLVQCAVGQVRVQPQPRHRRRHRRRHTGRGRVWVFVGVELDKVVNFQLLAGHIRLQCSQRFGKIAAHWLTPPFARPQTGWSRSWRGRAGPRARQSWRCGPGPRPGLRGCSR